MSLVFATQLARADALPTPDPDDGAIELPQGFRALVVADNLTPRGKKSGALRFLAIAPNGDIYSKAKGNGLFALSDTNSDGRADIVQEALGPDIILNRY
jgi:hypothetical protein